MQAALPSNDHPGHARPRRRTGWRMTSLASGVSVDPAVIDHLIREFDRSDTPGVAVGIAQHGRPVYRKGVGLASLELPVVLSPTMRMRIGSTTKHFTALAFCLLCEEGLATLDDEIGRHLPELHPGHRVVTVRQLLSHTSGLRDVFDYSMQLQGTNLRVTEAEMFAFYQADEGVNSAPETSWNYSNGGYMLVAMAIERLSGQTLEAVLAERVFGPLGMRETALRRWDTDFVPNSATLHLRTPGGWLRHHMGMELGGPGGICSSIDDMLRWLAHMDDPIVGTKETWRLITTPAVLGNGASTRYGLGLELGEYRGLGTVSHSGSVISGSSQMIKAPEVGLDIIVVANRSDVSTTSLANRIIDACVPGLDAAPERSHAPHVTGVFLSDRTGRLLEVSNEAGRSSLALDATPMPVWQDRGGGLRLPPEMDSGDLEVRPADASGERVVLTQFGETDAFDRVEPRPSVFPFVEASYRSAGNLFGATITTLGDAATLITTGPQGSQAFHLHPVVPNVWKAMSVVGSAFLSAVLTFDPDASAFAFTSGRTQGLRFRRRP